MCPPHVYVMRINTDTYFMKIAKLVSERSTCVKQKVGAVLVKDKHIISTGYNGAPRKIPHCTPETCLRLNSKSLEESHHCRGVHAEQNTIIQAAYHGTSTKGSIIYTTHFPCMSCTKILINAGVTEIVYEKEYDMENEIKMNLLHNAGIRIRHVKVD
jgi:dCMP deaminase